MSEQVILNMAVDIDDVAESLARMDYDTLFKLICALDAKQADYDFTLRLRDFFVAEIAACEAACDAMDRSHA